MIKDRIIYEDNDIIICHKPAGIATQTARVGQADMVSEIANYLAQKTGSAVYVGVVHRLDQPVEGIVVFAKNKRAAAALGRQITGNGFEKYYYAVVCGRGFASEGTLTDYLYKDGRTNTTRIVPPEVKDAQKAVLDYKIIANMPCRPDILCDGTVHDGMTHDEAAHDGAAHQEGEEAPPQIAVAMIRLHTGRHHQIRVQMSNAGMSLIGDRKYADATAALISGHMHVREIALCAYKLVFTHPQTGRRLTFEIRPENKIFQVEYWQNYAEHSPHNGR